MTERGRILRDTNAGPGLVTVEGKQYAFALEGMWRSDVPPRVGMFVDATFTEAGTLESLHAVFETQIAREQAQKAWSGALVHGKSVQGGLLKRFGVVSAIAEGLLLLVFFALPNIDLGSSYSLRRLSGWDATGFNPATMMTNDHGLLSLLGLLCLFAPVAVPFLRVNWARWLYTAPFAFAIADLLFVFIGANRQAHATAAAIGDVFGPGAASTVASLNPNQPSLAVGTYVVLLCALYLATRAFRSAS